MRLFSHPLATVAALAAAVGTVRPVPAPIAPQEALFHGGERARLVEYWNQPQRWQSEPQSSDGKNGPWAARATVEGSVWHLAYRNAVKGVRKIPPGQEVRAEDDGPTAGWEKWLSARIALDWHRAKTTAASHNATLPGATPLPQAEPEPPAPGPIPDTLLAACGNPPSFAKAVVPMRHRVRLDNPDDEYRFNDHVKVKERFAFYRSANGIVSSITKLDSLPEAVLADRFSKGGFSPSERRIFASVSRLEGGFDTVQTYDTGYVSVGFIQFITHADGKQSLSAVLQRQKVDFPEDYENDFRRYGIDVRVDKTLVVVDPSTGAELAGPDAVAKVVDDKRLVAVFQRAGRHSEAFQVAQIRMARERYWPGDERFDIDLPGGRRIAGKVSDIVRSEAGLAILLDRKVNTGNITPFADVVDRVAREKGCKDIDDLRAQEREIVAALRYRTDYLADPKLGQPGESPSAVLGRMRQSRREATLPDRGTPSRRPGRRTR